MARHDQGGHLRDLNNGDYVGQRNKRKREAKTMNSPEMTSQAAIEKVLQEAGTALHYGEIADRIVSQRLRTTFGHTPANTVYTTLIEKKTVFEKVARATFQLRKAGTPVDPLGADTETPQLESANPVMAFGMFWERDLVTWTSKPAILGCQQPGAEAVDMGEQAGIYLLHDFRDILYVGRAMQSTLGSRLSAHTRDRLKTRWNRFSWFGFRPVGEDGSLGTLSVSYDVGDVGVAMEALLIEALEPPQNRKGGDRFHGIEYIQAEDPEKAKERLLGEFQRIMSHPR